MDHALTCNTLSCRKELTDRALVTTCSHIFCLECAQKINATGRDSQTRAACPACGAQLANADDAILSDLNPSEEYKTSVLSGLSPSIIMECAGRALSFWAYQATQNICYQQYLYKTLSEKYSTLTMRLDKTVNEANAEIDSLHRTITGMLAEHEALRRKNDELIQAYKDKSRKLLQTQELYDKAKRKAEISQIQRAASDAVDENLNCVHLPHQREGSPIRNTESLLSMAGSNVPTRPDGSGMNTGIQRSNFGHSGDGRRWARTGLPPQASMMPLDGQSGQFARAPFLRRSLVTGSGPGTVRPSVHLHEVAGAFGANGLSDQRAGFGGVGLTSGLKVSQPPDSLGLKAQARPL